ncbi:MAG: RodZ domain-containing protein [Alphaproteobacteria bacterium]
MTERNKDIMLSAGIAEAVLEPLPMRETDVGARLRRAREALGVDVGRAATDLKIREDFLVALEKSRYSDLPGTPYAIGFLRAYAYYLKLDPAALVAQYRAEVAGVNSKADLVFLAPVREGRLPGGALAVVALVMAACAYAAWHYLWRDQNPALVVAPPPVVETTPTKTTTAATGDPTGPGTQQADSETLGASAAKPPAPKGPTAFSDSAIGRQLAHPADVQQPPATQQATVTPPAAVPVGPRVVFKAKADCWLRLVDRSGAVMLETVLTRGATLPIDYKPGMTAVIGNVGGLDIVVDGRTLKSLGPSGYPIAGLPLNPDELAKRP